MERSRLTKSTVVHDDEARAQSDPGVWGTHPPINSGPEGACAPRYGARPARRESSDPALARARAYRPGKQRA